MKLPLYQIDAFSSKPFSGNPAAVIPLQEWLSPELMQQIATENNLSETAFIVKHRDDYQIRWFTPEAEVPLCGHATLASGFVVFNELEPGRKEVRFRSANYELGVQRDGDLYSLDFPAFTIEPMEIPEGIEAALGDSPSGAVCGDFPIMLFDSEQAVRELRPDHEVLRKLKLHPVGVVVTAPGDKTDFVSRFFCPEVGMAEDPVTGSTHCALIPYWAKRLGRTKLSAHQASKRGGDLRCELVGDRVRIGGAAVKVIEGWIYL